MIESSHQPFRLTEKFISLKEFIIQEKSFSRSKTAYVEAQKLMPGGVNSPVRAFKSVGGSPLFISKADGTSLWDIDGNQYTDFVGSWGPAILGHNNPVVRKAVQEACEGGLSFGAPTLKETTLAQEISDAVPSMEKIRLVNSGTEACMSAMRVARGYTKKPGFIKFSGCYHGHCDFYLVKAGSGALTFGSPNSGGVPANIVKDTHLIPYNDPDALKECIRSNPDIGTIILEPMMGNCGFIKPEPEFMDTLRELQSKHKICIIFDEVMTGFRVSYGGAQSILNFKPNLSTFGKVIGGGMPLAAYGGNAEIMSCVAPEGDVYQAGTLSGNPIAVTAGLETLSQLKTKDYSKLDQRSKKISDGMRSIASDHGQSIQSDYCGGMFGFFFTKNKINNYETSSHLCTETYKKFFQYMLQHNFYFAPSAYEASFLSFLHSDKQIENLLTQFKGFCILEQENPA